MSRHVDTPYGPVPGCPDCGVIVLQGTHLCEHGVTPAPIVELSVTATIEDRDFYDKLIGGEA